MPQVGVSVSRGRAHRDEVPNDIPANETLQDRPRDGRVHDQPYDGPAPVRAGGVDDDWDIAGRAIAASPRPTRSARASQNVSSADTARARAAADRSSPARATVASPAETERPRRTSGPSETARAAVASAEARYAQSDRPAAARRPTSGPMPPPRPALATPPARPNGTGVPGRRTVTIQGRGTERYNAGFERRRPARRPHEREGFRPDRAAMWAVLLGLVLVLVAATSSHAAVLAQHIH